MYKYPYSLSKLFGDKMEAFVYCWRNVKNGMEYIGYHKGSENDGYISSSKNELFWTDHKLGLLERDILFRGSMEDCINEEINLLKSKSYDNLYNRNLNGKVIFTEDVRKKMSEAKKGKPQTGKHKAARSESLKGRKGGFSGKSHSSETIEKLKNVVRTSEHKKAISDAIKGRKGTFRGMKHITKICPCCHKECAVNVYARWHGNNCKEKINE